MRGRDGSLSGVIESSFVIRVDIYKIHFEEMKMIHLSIRSNFTKVNGDFFKTVKFGIRFVRKEISET